MTFDIIKAIVLGIVEGLTEFLPVSSTGHLLLVQRFFGFADEDFGKTFAVLIQFGAILALLSIYFVRLWQLAIGVLHRSGGAPLRHRRADRVPAGGGGRRARARLHQGRAVQRMDRLLHADRRRRGAAVDRPARSQAALSRRARSSRCRCISSSACASASSMIPGVSRSGATICRRHAARRRPALGRGVLVLARDADHGRRLRLRSLQEPRPDELRATRCSSRSASPCRSSAAWIVVKTFLGYVQRHGFALFAWWRVVVGALGLIALALGK